MAMSHFSQEQRNKPDLSNKIGVIYGVISAVLSLLSSRITEGKKKRDKHQTQELTGNHILKSTDFN